MSNTIGTDQDSSVPLERNGRTWLWVILGVVVVSAMAIGATMVMGKDVVYYKTATEVSKEPGQHVRLAGTLVKGSIVAQPDSGKTLFKITDGKTTINVVYTGSASTALSTASKPGTQIVAEGSLGKNDEFNSTQLIAKCPSKYQAKTSASS